MSKVIIVSNRLPVKVIKSKGQLQFEQSAGGLATGLGTVYKEGDNIWIGWPGLFLNKKAEKEKVTEELHKENMHPIFLTETEIKEFYEGFSNETLWPTFHYFNQYVVYNEQLWEAYLQVNQKFCNEVLKHVDPGDTLWIHDYQLLMLPELIRQKRPEVSIGFFLHIPFPSYEMFRTLPWREEILKGMLGADLIGFHTYDDMRHFMSSVSRLTGISAGQGQIEHDRRKIVVDSFPMGIDYNKYAEAAASEKTRQKIETFSGSLGKFRLILSIDRLDYSKGIPQRLKAFELFLEKYPQYRQKVSLIMIVVPSRDNVPKYKELKEEIDEMVGRINGNFGRVAWTPIHYFYRTYSLESLSAFYCMSDVALVTPMRDGMNLVCKEYIASKLDKKGVLILSEMAGSSKELSDAILINPSDINKLIEALHKALTMPEQEQVKRNTEMQRSLQRYNIHHWVKLFMDRLEGLKEHQQSFATKKLDELSAEKLLEDYSNAQQRLLFLDYDGTLTSFTEDPQRAEPDIELIEILTKLSADDKNKIVIISGRDRNTLDRWLGELNLDITCEHGVWLRENGDKWHTIEKLNNSWKKQLRPIMELYVDRTPGSFIEEKDYSLVWHYRKVETGLGEMRTRELTSHLKYLSANANLQVLEGDKVVEVKNLQVNKGRAASKWLDKTNADFIFAIGDDWTDEDTFKAMPDYAYTIKVGSNSSAAKYSVPSTKEVRELLLAFCKKVMYGKT